MAVQKYACGYSAVYRENGTEVFFTVPTSPKHLTIKALKGIIYTDAFKY